IVRVIGDLARQNGRSVRMLGYDGCPPIVDVGISGSECLEHNQQAYDHLIHDRAVSVVVLAARWNSYVTAARTGSGAGRVGGFVSRVTDAHDRPLADDRLWAALEDRLRRTVQGLLDAGKVVVLVYPVPESNFDVPGALMKYSMAGRDPAEFSTP